jgi:hypothetical protein
MFKLKMYIGLDQKGPRMRMPVWPRRRADPAAALREDRADLAQSPQGELGQILPVGPMYWLTLPVRGLELAQSLVQPCGNENCAGLGQITANFRALTGIFSQSVGPSLGIWANPVRFSCAHCADLLEPGLARVDARLLLVPGPVA